MVDVSIVNKTSPEANWNRQADRQEDTQDALFYKVVVRVTASRARAREGFMSMLMNLS